MSGWRVAAAVVAIAVLASALLFLRTPTAWLTPYPVIDDLNILAYYFNYGSAGRFPLVYLGYASLVPDAILYAAANLAPVPIDQAPRLVGFLALAYSGLCFAVLCLPSFHFIAGDLKGRAAVALCLALLPLALRPFLTGAMWVNNVSLMLYVLLVLFVTPRTKGQAVLYVLAGVLAAWSHPLSLLLVPVQFALAALLARREPAAAAAHGVLMALLGWYALRYVGGSGVRPDLGLLLTPSFWIGFADLILQGVVVDALLGLEARRVLAQVLPPAIPGLVLAAAVLWGLHRLPRKSLVPLAMAAVAIPVITLASLVARAGDPVRWLTTPTDYRFLFVPKVLFLLMVLAVAIAWADRRRLRLGLVWAVVALVVAGQNYLGAWRYATTPAPYEERDRATRLHAEHAAALAQALAELRRAVEDPRVTVNYCWDDWGGCTGHPRRWGPNIARDGATHPAGPFTPPDWPHPASDAPANEVKVRSAVFDLSVRRLRP